MPIVRVEILEGRPQAVKEKLAAEITETVARHLGNDPQHIYVIFDEVKAENWATGGIFFSQRKAP